MLCLFLQLVHIGLILLLPGVAIFSQSIFQRFVDPRRLSLHAHSVFEVRERGSLLAEHRHHIDKPLHTNSLATDLHEGLHESQSLPLHSSDLDNKLRSAGPHVAGRVWGVRFRRETGNLLHQSRQEQLQPEDRALHRGIRHPLCHHHHLLREDILHRYGFQQTHATPHQRYQTERNERHQDGLGDLFLFRNLLPAVDCGQSRRRASHETVPPHHRVLAALHGFLHKPGGVRHNEQAVQESLFKYPDV